MTKPPQSAPLSFKSPSPHRQLSAASSLSLSLSPPTSRPPIHPPFQPQLQPHPRCLSSPQADQLSALPQPPVVPCNILTLPVSHKTTPSPLNPTPTAASLSLLFSSPAHTPQNTQPPSQQQQPHCLHSSPSHNQPPRPHSISSWSVPSALCLSQGRTDRSFWEEEKNKRREHSPDWKRKIDFCVCFDCCVLII